MSDAHCLSYKNMLLTYANIRHLKRWIFVVPVLTPRLSSYWLYFITSVNYALASSLVDSVKNQAICGENHIREPFPHSCMSFEESLRKVLDKVEQNPLILSWKDTLISEGLESRLSSLGTIPQFGCLIDQRIVSSTRKPQALIDKIWVIRRKHRMVLHGLGMNFARFDG